MHLFSNTIYLFFFFFAFFLLRFCWLLDAASSNRFEWNVPDLSEKQIKRRIKQMNERTKTRAYSRLWWPGRFFFLNCTLTIFGAVWFDIACDECIQMIIRLHEIYVSIHRLVHKCTHVVMYTRFVFRFEIFQHFFFFLSVRDQANLHSFSLLCRR